MATIGVANAADAKQRGKEPRAVYVQKTAKFEQTFGSEDFMRKCIEHYSSYLCSSQAPKQSPPCTIVSEKTEVDNDSSECVKYNASLLFGDEGDYWFSTREVVL